MVYVFGNSHSSFFTNSTPSRFGEGENKNEYFRSFSLGPVIAYNFYEHHFPLMIEWINKLPITGKDYILIAIGEVDCRWHIPKQAELQKRNAIEIVHECIDRFFRSHVHLKEYGYNVISWGGHPSTTSGHNDDPSNPVYGDCLFRNKISLEWNNYLREKSKINNIDFISIMNYLIDNNGLTKMQYFKDYCHLDSNKLLDMVIDKFKKQKLL